MKTITFSNEEIRELIKFYEDELKKTEERLNTISAIIQKLNASLGEEGTEAAEVDVHEPAPVTDKTPQPASETKTESAPKPAAEKEKTAVEKPTASTKSTKKTKKSTQSKSTTKKKSTSSATKTSATTAQKKQKLGMQVSTKKARQEVNLKKLDWENFFYEQLKAKDDVMSISEFSDNAYEYFKLHIHKPKNVNYKIRTELNKLVNNGKLKKERISGIKGFAYGLPSFFERKNLGSAPPKEPEPESEQEGSPEKKTTTSEVKDKQSNASKASTAADVEATTKNSAQNDTATATAEPKTKEKKTDKQKAAKATATEKTTTQEIAPEQETSAKTEAKETEDNKTEAVEKTETATATSTKAEPTKEELLEPDYIVQLIDQEDRPLAEGEISDRIFEKGTFKRKERKTIEKKVKENVNKLTYTDKKLKKYIIPDSRITAYGLSRMFDENDKIKKEYEEKVMF